MATQYKLKVTNNSKHSGSICVYQKNPGQEKDKNLYSLAWFSKACNPETEVTFTWSIDYEFVWSQTGELTSNVTFDASETKPADPSNLSKNSITLTKTDNGAYMFKASTSSAPEGTLKIQADNTIPYNDVSVGIAMSGKPAFAIPADANLSYTFIPHLEYFVAFGDYEEGEVLDLNTVTETAEVVFPCNVYSLSMELKEDNTWSEPISLKVANEKKLKLMRENK